MATGLESLSQFHDGIRVDDFDVHVPWLVSEAELFDLIPEKAFSRSIAGWPMLQFTLLGVKALFGFNFVTHHDSKFVEVQFHSDDTDSIEETLRDSSRHLLEQLGASGQTQNPELLLWSDDHVKIEDSLWPVWDSEGNKRERHKLSIFATFWIPPEKLVSCRKPQDSNDGH